MYFRRQKFGYIAIQILKKILKKLFLNVFYTLNIISMYISFNNVYRLFFLFFAKFWLLLRYLKIIKTYLSHISKYIYFFREKMACRY